MDESNATFEVDRMANLNLTIKFGMTMSSFFAVYLVLILFSN